RSCRCRPHRRARRGRRGGASDRAGGGAPLPWYTASGPSPPAGAVPAPRARVAAGPRAGGEGRCGGLTHRSAEAVRPVAPAAAVALGSERSWTSEDLSEGAAGGDGRAPTVIARRALGPAIDGSQAIAAPWAAAGGYPPLRRPGSLSAPRAPVRSAAVRGTRRAAR